MAYSQRTTTRESNATVYDSGKHRPVLITVEATAGLVSFRLKGTKRQYSLPASYLYMEACRRHVALEKARKAKERKAKRKSAA